MRITRRDFINAACASAILAASGSLTSSFGQKTNKLFPIPGEAYADPLLSMSSNKFREFIGQTFKVTGEGIRPTPLVLTEVNLLERPQNTIGGYYGECFSLVFEGDLMRQLKQGSYSIETNGVPQFSALLVPIGMRRVKYEIVVNHISR